MFKISRLKNFRVSLRKILNSKINLSPVDESANLNFIKRTYKFHSELRNSNENNKNYEWLNFGYWENANTVETSCTSMVDLMISYAGLKDGENLLDVGYGYGIQDVYMSEKYKDLKIYGINVIDEQIAHANFLLEKNKLTDRVKLIKGDAVDIPFESGFFEKVFAIESAMHFNLRKDFFKEALRVLKKGGVICLADCLPYKDILNKDSIVKASEELGVPNGNLYTIEKYVKLLRDVGFSDIEYQDISKWVLPHAYACFKDINQRGNTGEFTVDDPDTLLEKWRNEYYEITSIYSYYIIKAKK